MDQIAALLVTDHRSHWLPGNVRSRTASLTRRHVLYRRATCPLGTEGFEPSSSWSEVTVFFTTGMEIAGEAPALALSKSEACEVFATYERFDRRYGRALRRAIERRRSDAGEQSRPYCLFRGIVCSTTELRPREGRGRIRTFDLTIGEVTALFTTGNRIAGERSTSVSASRTRASRVATRGRTRVAPVLAGPAPRHAGRLAGFEPALPGAK